MSGTHGRIDNSESPIRSEIRLPSSEYKLYCWKVRQGTAVRKGETIGMAVLKAAIHSSTMANSCTQQQQEQQEQQQYKRPTKRRRMAPPQQQQPAVANSTGNETSPVNAAAATTTTTTTTAKSSSSSSSSSGTLRSLIFKSASTAKAGESTAETTTENTSPSSATEFPNAPTDAAKPTGNNGCSNSKTNKVPILAPTDGIIRFGKPSVTNLPNNDNNNDKDALVIGVIVACEHPTVVDNLCVVCGQETILSNPENRRQNNNNNNVSPNTSTHLHGDDGLTQRVTVAGGITMEISASEGQRMAQQDAERLRKQKKLSLVLDLDHTLLHATNDIRARRHQGRPDVRTLILPVQVGEPVVHNHKAVWVQHFVKLRPGVREFLEMASRYYEVGVYTAGTRQYAEQVTVLLARYMVKARMDQTGLDHVRHRIAHVQEQLQRKQAQDAAQQQQEEQTPSQETRRVRFGESTERTDEVTAADLAQLRQELAEAERLELEALEYRQRLFGARIVSRTDVADLGMNVKSLKRVFPCGGEMAVVVDDREDVWANASDNETKGEPPDNMLLVRPYHWKPFAGFADVNNASGDDYGADEAGEIDGETEKDDDQQLLWTADILRRIHEAYYEVLEPNPQPGRRTVPEIVRDMRRQILKNTRMVLSSLVRLDRQQASHLPRPPHVRHAENLGATLLPTVGPDTTHVVAAIDGTEKVMAARRVPGCYIVKPLWLMECVWTLSRRDVRPHLWPAGTKAPPRSYLETNKEASSAVSAEGPEVQENHKETASETGKIVTEKEEDDDDDDDYDEDDLMAELQG